MTPIDSAGFERLVGEALDSLPHELGRLMHNVAVVVEDRHEGENLLGLYEGIPLTERAYYGHAGYGEVAMPDKITLYRLALCEAVQTLDELVEEVTVTVVHEVAHHFGIDDEKLAQWGWG